jgi:hypothetical protein
VTLFIIILAFLLAFTYSSFFEYYVHRYLMHKPFPLYEAFKGHTIVHHQIYKWDKSFEAQVPGRPPHVALRWYAFPVMIALHAPVFGLLQHFTHLPLFWPCMTGCTLYFIGYEYTHYLMHVPKGHYVERFRWFRFLKEHHRLHHKYYLRNINVFIPLGDVCFGTLVKEEGWRSKQAKHKRNLEFRKAEKKAEEKKVPAKTEA